MGKNVTTASYELEVVSPGTGSAKIESSPSSDVKINGDGVFFGTITISVSSSNGGGSMTDNNGSGTGTLTGTGSKVTSNGQPAVLEGDTATIIITGGTASGYPVPAPGSVTVKVKKAGQSDVVAL